MWVYFIIIFPSAADDQTTEEQRMWHVKWHQMICSHLQTESIL